MKVFSLILNLLFLASCLFSQDLHEGLQGHYKFNQNLLDLSDNEIEGQGFAIEAGIGIEDTPATSYSFNGIDAYINLGIDNRNINNTLTVSAWVKTTKDKRQFIISKYNSAEDRGYFLAIDGGYVLIGGRNNSSIFTQCVSTSRIDDGEWHQVIGIIDNNNWSIWVDCNLENTAVTSALNVELFCSDPLTVGNWYEGSQNASGRFFDGQIDEVRIYNRVIDEDEVQLLCNINAVSTNFTEHQLQDAQIFPNPTNNIIKVSFSEPINDNIYYSVYDNLGKLVKQGVLNSPYLISMTHLSKGHYTLHLIKEHKPFAIKRIILQ